MLGERLRVVRQVHYSVHHENSLDLAKEMLNAIMNALAAHGTMSKQALDSPKLRDEMQDVLLGPGQLYEALREQGAAIVSIGPGNPS